MVSATGHAERINCTRHATACSSRCRHARQCNDPSIGRARENACKRVLVSPVGNSMGYPLTLLNVNQYTCRKIKCRKNGAHEINRGLYASFAFGLSSLPRNRCPVWSGIRKDACHRVCTSTSTHRYRQGGRESLAGPERYS